MRPDPAVAAGRQGGRSGGGRAGAAPARRASAWWTPSTSSVALTREIGARLAARGIGFADAPVARTREAAARGELSIMVGATRCGVRPYPPDAGDDGHRRDALRRRSAAARW